MEVNVNTSRPVRLEIDYPERSSRILALCSILYVLRVLILLPVIVVFYIVNIVVIFATIIGWFAVLFVGKYPRGIFDFLVRYMNWNLEISAYFLSMTDRYPPFFPR